MGSSRREFLQAVTCASLLPVSFGVLAKDPVPRYLVLVELKGGNDGLNTLAPYESDAYRKLRPMIGLKKSDVIHVGESTSVGSLGLQSSMSRLAGSIGQDLAIIQGLGYPNQNRSHFKSIALWETGGDGNRSQNTGWLTQSIEKLYGTGDIAAHGASLEGSTRLFSKGKGIYVSMARLNQMASVENKESARSSNKLMNLIAKRKRELVIASQSLVGQLQNFSDRMIPRRMPHGSFSSQLSDVLRVIGAEIPLPVLHIQHGSFDTHEGQPWRHPRLLEELSEGLSGLRDNLQAMNRWHDVLVMTYSEFGRRAAENGAEGTDHGTASVHLMLGGRVNPGLYGQYPAIDDLEDGDLKFTKDYRAVYEQVCRHWLRDGASPWRMFADDEFEGLVG